MMMLCQTAHIAAHIYSHKKLGRQCGAAKKGILLAAGDRMVRVGEALEVGVAECNVNKLKVHDDQSAAKSVRRVVERDCP